jgi:hypothetical protein
MVGRPTRPGLADQIAWEELFLLSLYQMTQFVLFSILMTTEVSPGRRLARRFRA